MRKVFALAALFFLIFVGKTYATNDPVAKTLTITGVSCVGSYTNCDLSHATNTGTLTSNAVNFSPSNNGAFIDITPNIAVGSNIQSITMDFSQWVSNASSVNSSPCNVDEFRWYRSGGTLVAGVTNSSPSCGSGGSLTYSNSSSPFTYTAFPASSQTWQSGDYIRYESSICNGTGCSSLYLNNINGGNYFAVPIPTLNLSSVTASAGAQTVTFNASGDTQFTQAGEQCKVSLYEYDITDPTNPRIVSGGVAYVLLDANNPRTTTLYQGQSTYLGYGFTSSVSTWEADNISFPYFNTKNTDIRSYTSCYHQVQNSDGSLSTPIYDIQQQALDPSSAILYDKNLIATPSALQNVVGYAQPQCTSTDIICQIVENIQAGLVILFAPNATIDTEDFTNVNNAMLSRAPFAYGLAALNTNTTIAPVASTSAIGLTFDFSNITGVPIPTSYKHISYTDNGYIQSGVFAPLRPYEVIILWTIFFMYLVFVLRSIFT